MAIERLVTTPAALPDEEPLNWSLRPTRIGEYIGQADLIARLSIALQAARGRTSPLDHVLLHGPPGLGKTTLAHVIAAEMGTKAYTTSGPALSKGTDLVAALTRLESGDILFIDEIHRMPIAVEEFIYPAMEDYRIDVPVDSGMHARTVQIKLKPFTLIGATTRAGLISAPLRSRFVLAHHLRFYTPDELLAIVRRSAHMLGMPHTDLTALKLIADRSRGTPRIANRLLRRVRDYSQVKAAGELNINIVQQALAMEGVDPLGLDELDRQYLRIIGTTYKGGPCGVEAIAATMSEDAGTLEDVVEPFLLQLGFLARTRRGRMLTAAGAKHIGVAPPPEFAADPET
jgi:holliday junction DNA helicase RuvB